MRDVHMRESAVKRTTVWRQGWSKIYREISKVVFLRNGTR